MMTEPEKTAKEPNQNNNTQKKNKKYKKVQIRSNKLNKGNENRHISVWNCPDITSQTGHGDHGQWPLDP